MILIITLLDSLLGSEVDFASTDYDTFLLTSPRFDNDVDFSCADDISFGSIDDDRVVKHHKRRAADWFAETHGEVPLPSMENLYEIEMELREDDLL